MNLPEAFRAACHRTGLEPTPHCLWVKIAGQKMVHFHSEKKSTYQISTAKAGTGQESGSFQTPLGLHRIAEKIGAGEPVGTVFRGRVPVATNGKGNTQALITDRILWLAGLEPGLNQGGTVDSHERYIYIHGVGDESRLGQPNSQGCIHLAATDLLPLYDAVPSGTLVFISEN
jgi:hypothetical protein